MATATPLGPAESADSAEAARRVAQAGRATIRRQNPPSRGRSTEALCPLQVRRAHIRTPTRHRAPNQEPGRILIPGDGAAGDQGAQNRPACAAIVATRRLRPVPSQRFLALWCQAHTPSCVRQVTSTSVRMVKPGPAGAPRGHAPLRTDTLSLARTISDRRFRAGRWPAVAGLRTRTDRLIRRAAVTRGTLQAFGWPFSRMDHVRGGLQDCRHQGLSWRMLRAGRLPKAQRSILVRTFCAPFKAARRAARAADSGEPMARAPVTAPGH